MTSVVSRSSRGLAALVLLGACAEESIDHPLLTVYRYRYDDRCYDACQQIANIDDVSALPGELCGMLNPCTFRPGRDNARIIVDFGDLAFADEVPDFTISMLVDGEEAGTPIQVDGQSDTADGGFGVREFRVPLAPPGELRFSVDVKDSFNATSNSAQLEEPSLVARFRDCDELESCRLPAGAGMASVVLDVPRGLDEVQLVSTIADIVQVGVPSVPVTGHPGEAIVVEVKIPDRANTEWKLEPKAGPFEGMSAKATLDARLPLELGAVSAQTETMENGQFPRRIALEPKPVCRRVTVVARNTQATGGQHVTLSTSRGSFEAQGSVIDLAFDEQGLVSAELDLGDEIVSEGEVELTAESPEFGKVEHRWRLLSLLPEKAELFIPGSPQTLDAGGTPDGVTVTGVLRPPAALLAPSLPVGFEPPRFSAGTTAIVVVDAHSTLSNPLECGTPLPPENIDCDRSGAPGSPQGGCAWTPTAIAVSPEGGFQFVLPANQCFGGEVSFRVVAPAYTSTFDIGTCVGEQIPDPIGALVPISADVEPITYVD